MGPSRILVLGPDSSLGPMIAATIAPLALADGDPARAVALASMLALLVGGVMILAGVAKLGFVADLLSKPTQIGYMNGLALTILVGQLPKLLGFSVDADGFIDETVGFVKGVTAGDVVGVAAIIGIGSLVLILVLQRWLPKLPAVLIAVVLAIVAVMVFDLIDARRRGGRGAPPGVPAVHDPARGRSRTCCSSFPARWGSRSSPSSTRSRPRRRSPRARGSGSTATRR